MYCNIFGGFHHIQKGLSPVITMAFKVWLGGFWWILGVPRDLTSPEVAALLHELGCPPDTTGTNLCMGQNWVPRICRWLWVTVSLKTIPTSQKYVVPKVFNFDPYPSEHDDLTQTKLNSLKHTVTPENYGMTWDDWRGPKRIGKLVKHQLTNTWNQLK
jgi:hypothetical protein